MHILNKNSNSHKSCDNLNLSHDTTAAFYVSPAGNDQWSGRLAEPDSARSDGPFATLDRAIAAVRALKIKNGLTVLLRGGTYFLKEPLILRPEDSGTALAPVTYKAYPGEKPVISAGFSLTEWKETQVNGCLAWVTDAPPWPFHQLWVNGRRRCRPRLPKQGLYRVKDAPPAESFYKGQKEFTAEMGQVRAWRNLRDVEIVVMIAWADSRLPIESVDESTGRVTSTLYSTLSINSTIVSAPTRFYVDNVFEALDEPGLWYLDRTLGKVFYIPLPGEEPSTAEVIVPRHRAALIISGDTDAGKFVEHICFEGIVFAHSEWWRTPTTPISRWEIHDHSDTHIRRVEVKQEVDDRAADMQCAVSVTGVIEAVGCRHCRFVHCTMAHAGNYGIELGRGSSDNEIVSCAFHDLGGGGVKLGTQFMVDAPISGNNCVMDCDIGDVGLLFHAAVGIWLGETGNNTIAHNSVHDLYYSGISVGWTWGYQKSGTQNNLIEYNHIYNIGKKWLHDMGGIYTLANSPGTIIRYNLIHDVCSHVSGASGIYYDEGSSYIVSEFNLVYRCHGNNFQQHFGRENVVRNNIFVMEPRSHVLRGKGDGEMSFTFEHNIVYFAEGDLLIGNLADGKYRFRSNLYWNTCGQSLKFGPWTWEEWRQRGYDDNSLIADPKFADPEHDDFTLAADSPALQIGFIPFDLSTVGPRGPVGAER